MFVIKKSTNNTSKTRKSAGISSAKASPSPKKRNTTSSKALKSVMFVLPLGNGWVVKSEKASRFMVITDSKREAIAVARNVARTKKTRLVVYSKKGLIELKENYVA